MSLPRIIAPLYHWSPRERRKSIERLGLVPGKRPTCSSSLDWNGKEWVPEKKWRPDYVCLSPDPEYAMLYSWRIHGEPGQTWDLWQVFVDGTDQIVWRRREKTMMRNWTQGLDGPTFTMLPRRPVVEVRIGNRIPKRRIEWIGERTLRDVRGRPR